MERKHQVAAAVAVLTAVTALTGWGVLYEPDRLVTRHYDIDLPQVQHPVTIAILSDIHVGSPFIDEQKLLDVAAMTNAAEPDVIVLAGDYVIHDVVGGEFAAPEVMSVPLSRLQAPLGVYAVLGNHDYWYDGPRCRRALEQAGITVLEDETAQIGEGEEALWLLGIGDEWTERHDLGAAVATVPDDDRPAILLAHSPDIFPQLSDRFALTISGHTHGGQIQVPGWGALLVPSEHGTRYAYGHIIEDGRHLLVSPGIGTSLLPVRLNVPPEITVVTIH